MPSTPPTNEHDARREALVRDLEAVATGDPAALRRVYAATAGTLNALLVRMLGDRSEAEEVLQEVYLSVWRGRLRYRAHVAHPMTWLISIARNRGIDRLRSNRAHISRRVILPDMTALMDPGANPAEHFEESDRQRQLINCLDQLDQKQSTAIRAAFFEGLTYEELADREGVPLGTMKSWIRRGLLRLRTCLSF